MEHKLRIRIPPRTYEEEMGPEFIAFNDLCRYIKPNEWCGNCEIGDEACSLCMAVHVKKPIKCTYMFNECLKHFDIWFRRLLRRKNS